MISTLTGCSNLTGEKEFRESLSKVEEPLHAGNWDEGKKHANELLDMYKTNKWRLQMIGAEDEYEQLHESINRLRTAIDEKNLLQAKLEMATIYGIFEEMYSI